MAKGGCFFVHRCKLAGHRHHRLAEVNIRGISLLSGFLINTTVYVNEKWKSTSKENKANPFNMGHYLPCCQVWPPVGAVWAHARGPPITSRQSTDTQPWWLQYRGSQRGSWKTGYFLSGGRGHREVRSNKGSWAALPRSLFQSVWVSKIKIILSNLDFSSFTEDALFPGKRLAELIVELNSLLNTEDIRLFETDMWVMGSDHKCLDSKCQTSSKL